MFHPCRLQRHNFHNSCPLEVAQQGPPLISWMLQCWPRHGPGWGCRSFTCEGIYEWRAAGNAVSVRRIKIKCAISTYRQQISSRMATLAVRSCRDMRTWASMRSWWPWRRLLLLRQRWNGPWHDVPWKVKLEWIMAQDFRHAFTSRPAIVLKVDWCCSKKLCKIDIAPQNQKAYTETLPCFAADLCGSIHKSWNQPKSATCAELALPAQEMAIYSPLTPDTPDPEAPPQAVDKPETSKHWPLRHSATRALFSKKLHGPKYIKIWLGNQCQNT